MSTESALLGILTEKIRQDALVLPTLPEVAVKIRDVADDPASTLHDIARVVSTDTALSARIIRVASTAYNSRSANIDSVSTAVFRIGLRAIKNVAIAMALEQLFISNNQTVKNCLRKIWHQSISVSCAAVALSEEYLNTHKRSAISRDRLALAGLLHEIGALPILTEIEVQAPDMISAAFLDNAIEQLSCTVGVHIVRHWNLGEDFARVVWQWRNQSFQSDDVEYLDFIRLGHLYMQYSEQQVDVKDELEYYVDKGVISSTDVFLCPEFINKLAQERTLYE
ncbi:signal transduction superfamily protein with modified HD-GYP domain [Neiella marina]|uniref:Signal transduction superfamily protein with modified HD-GYP domain n=1 Tax=Neiella marina TaxID=508461 RepID=A0A8J2XL27_9GAMM|nr:HDOD domain-containing protein [Neiella marina]GGA66015.1 signal transduction superfamily protein with modified HD-GYP domain [Neiella marina]